MNLLRDKNNIIITNSFDKSNIVDIMDHQSIENISSFFENYIINNKFYHKSL